MSCLGSSEESFQRTSVGEPPSEPVGRNFAADVVDAEASGRRLYCAAMAGFLATFHPLGNEVREPLGAAPEVQKETQRF